MQIYTVDDRQLRSADGFILQFPKPGGGKPVQVEWQFPPKIVNNNMSGEFQSNSPRLPGLYPTYSYSGPNERSFNVETTYVIDGGYWNTERVKKNVKLFRDYFFDIRDAFTKEISGILVKLWDYGGNGKTTFFIRNLSIKHNSTYISTKNGQGGYKDIHPLRTDVSFELVLWWNYVPLKGQLNPINNVAGIPDEVKKGFDQLKKDAADGKFGDTSWY